MRLAAAVIAAVLSVVTGGPLRCPCRLVALVAPESRDHATARPAPDRLNRHSCACGAHEEPDDSGPSEPVPAPGDRPCRHAPGVDLAPPLAGGERAAGDHAPGDLSVLKNCPAAAGPPAHGPGAFRPATSRLTPSPPDRLRYCHAFRC